MPADNETHEEWIEDRLQRQFDRVFGPGYQVNVEIDSTVHVGYLCPKTGAGFPIGRWDPDEGKQEEALETLATFKDGAGTTPEGDAAIWAIMPDFED